jgi:protein TonB
MKSRSKPVYPPIAVAAQVSGTVITRVLVDRSGDIQHVRVLSGPAMLQQASIDAAKNWKFMQMTFNKHAVPYEAELVFTFAHVTSDPRMVIVKMAP